MSCDSSGGVVTVPQVSNSLGSILGGAESFIFSTTPRPAVERTLPPVQYCTGYSSEGRTDCR